MATEEEAAAVAAVAVQLFQGPVQVRLAEGVMAVMVVEGAAVDSYIL